MAFHAAAIRINEGWTLVEGRLQACISRQGPNKRRFAELERTQVREARVVYPTLQSHGCPSTSTATYVKTFATYPSMDDLYANAWSDRQEIALPELKSPVIDSNPSWVSPNHSLPPHDEEADLAAPSWSTGAEIHWNEPSESSGFSWSQTDPDLAWGASTYEGIQIRNTPTEENNELSLPTPEPEEETTVASTPHSPHASTLEDTSLSQPSPDLTEALASVVHSPGFSSSPRSTSPDAFGTFETAATADDDPAFALRQNELEADTWGSAWNAPKVNEESTDGAMDEWEVAKQQKAKQDRKVVS